jgi:hypothetical protein
MRPEGLPPELLDEILAGGIDRQHERDVSLIQAKEGRITEGNAQRVNAELFGEGERICSVVSSPAFAGED